MGHDFAVLFLLSSSLIIASAAVDITLETDDIIHSPFSEETGNDAGLNGHKVFTKEELSKYDGKNVRTAAYFALNCLNILKFIWPLRYSSFLRVIHWKKQNKNEVKIEI